jgi:hypothetical protein
MMWLSFCLLLLPIHTYGTCDCHCCIGVLSTTIGTSVTISDCVTSMVGTLSATTTQTECTKDACTLAYPSECPSASESGVIFTMYEQIIDQSTGDSGGTSTTVNTTNGYEQSPSPSPSHGTTGNNRVLVESHRPDPVDTLCVTLSLVCILGHYLFNN